MGMGEEYRLALLIEYECALQLRDNCLAYKIWQTRESKFINVSEMSDRHIQNTIAMLMRKPEVDVYALSWVGVLTAELKQRSKDNKKILFDTPSSFKEEIYETWR